MKRQTVTLSPTGGAGAATASATVSVPSGAIRLVRCETAGQSSGTTDVTITSLGDTVAGFTNLGNGSKVCYPRIVAHSVAGVALSTAGDELRERPYVHGSVTVAVAQGDAAVGGVKVTLYIEDDD